MRGVDRHIFKGMYQEVHPSNQPADLLWDARNIRFDTRDDNSLMTISNEKGPKYVSSVDGKYLGSCVFPDKIVVFIQDITADHPDNIYQVFKDNPTTWHLLYSGELNFNVFHQLQTIGSVESKDVQKVYWTDGINQPRVLRTATEEQLNEMYKDSNWTRGGYYSAPYNYVSFDFIPEVNLMDGHIEVETIPTGGLFPGGVIQYFFSYYNKYLQETNIFYATKPIEVAYPERGLSPEETGNCSFKISLDDLDGRFDFIRIYSIQRTSLDATPIAKRVVDLSISKNAAIEYIDTGTQGETIDPDLLLYIGGEEIIAESIVVKQDTMFFGNLTLKQQEVPNLHQEIADLKIGYFPQKIQVTDELPNTFYNKEQHITDYSPFFKNKETYRFGLQFQDEKGKWSIPYFVGDKTIKNNLQWFTKNDESLLLVDLPSVTLDSNIIESLLRAGFVRVRPVVVFPQFYERRVITQGILCPTVYCQKYRDDKGIYAQSSWFARPIIPDYQNNLKALPGAGVPSNILSAGTNRENILNNINHVGSTVEFRHDHTLGDYDTLNAEIDGINADSEYVFKVDTSILTMHSPEIEFDEGSFAHIPKGVYLGLIGKTYIDATASYLSIQTSTPTISDSSKGLLRNSFVRNLWGGGKYRFASGYLYHSELTALNKNDDKQLILGTYPDGKNPAEGVFKIYPWQRSGSLSNDTTRTDGTVTSSLLSQKHLSNLLYSGEQLLFEGAVGDLLYQVSTPTYINGELEETVRLWDYTKRGESSLESLNILYKGVVDTALPTNVSSKLLYIVKSDDQVNWTREHATTSVLNNSSFYKAVNASDSTDAVSKTSADQLFRFNRPVRMRYKSGKHLVFGLCGDKERTANQILPIVQTSNDSQRVLVSFTGDQDDENLSLYNVHFDKEPLTISKEYLAGNKMVIEYPQDSGIYYINYNLNTDEFFIPESTDPKFYSNHFRQTTKQELEKHYNEAHPEIQTDFILGLLDSKNVEWDLGTEYEEGELLNLTTYSAGARTITVSGDSDSHRPFLFLAELYQDFDPDNIHGEMFGGKLKDSEGKLLSTDGAKTNQWIPAGNPVVLKTAEGPLKSAQVIYSRGDTWFQRYDCLKTYPYSLEDENCVTEIVSFKCETRANLAGRYDRNIGALDNTAMTPANFNKYNPVYSQKDNFFSYRLLDADFYKRDSFPATLTWTLPKKAVDFIDEWTHITMGSTLDLNGTYGPIKALLNNNDTLYAFQESAISQILYNEQAQIVPENGAPIEIANSGKVQGFRQVAENRGVEDKAHVLNTPLGTYYLDRNTKNLMSIIPGSSHSSINQDKGFTSYFNELTFRAPNNRADGVQGLTLFFDNIYNDLYVSTIDECLLYSAKLGQFTSFMDYSGMTNLFNWDSDSYYLWNGRPLFLNEMTEEEVPVTHPKVALYKMHSGEHCKFPSHSSLWVNGQPELVWYPFKLSFVSAPKSNGESSVPWDKIYDNLQIYADLFHKNSDDLDELNSAFFDTIRVQTDYQDSDEVPVETPLTINRYTANAKKKFRIWGVTIPRDKDYFLQRIRNPWAKITLERKKEVLKETNISGVYVPQDVKLQLHNIDVYYTY